MVSRWPVWSMRTRLLLLVALAALPAFALFAANGLDQRRQAAARAQSEALSLARLVAASQDERIQSTRLLLAGLAEVPEVQAGAGAAGACADLLADLLALHADMANLGAADANGDIYCSALPTSRTVNIRDRLYFRTALEQGVFSAGEYQIGRITGIPSINFGYPLTAADGERVGVVFAALDITWLADIGSQAALPAGSTVTVIDRNGTVLARWPDSELWVARVLPEAPILEAMLEARGEGTAEVAGVDGEVRLYGYVPLGGASTDGVYLSVGVPTALAYAEIDAISRRTLLGLAAFALLSALSAWFGAEVFVVRPIGELVRATQRVAAGDLSARTGLAGERGEIGALAEAFDQMATALEARSAAQQAAEADLLRVNRALRALSEANQALVRAADESSLLAEICRVIVEVGGYRMAWVGLAESGPERRVLPAASAGDRGGYLESIEVHWADVPTGQGPVGTAIRTGQPVVTRDVSSDPQFAPWRDRALARGFAAVLALPLAVEGRVVGALAIYSGAAGGFAEQEQDLLGELADDLAFGMQTLRERAGRQRAEASAQDRLAFLSALAQIDRAIMASMDPRVTFDVLLAQLMEYLLVDAADILWYDPHTRMLVHSASRGFRTPALRHTRLPLGEGNAGRAALDRTRLLIPDLRQDPGGLERSPLLDEEGFVTYLAVPLLGKGTVQGVLEVFMRRPFEPTQEWIDALETFAGQAAIAVDNAMLFDALRKSNQDLLEAYEATLQGWSRALELRDQETQGHSARVVDLTTRLALRLGMREADLVHVRRGVLLHDIGKMVVPDSILLKAGPLSDEEWRLMRGHPQAAYDLLSPIEYLRPALDIPYAHHERWDGAGYPRGLRGTQIPLAARIFAVVDVWDALTSDRPYRAAWPAAQAREHMREQSGRHFDPRVVESFLDLIDGYPGGPPAA